MQILAEFVIENVTNQLTGLYSKKKISSSELL